MAPILLVAQRLDRVLVGRLDCGPEAGDEADRGGDAEAEEDRPEGGGCLEVEEEAGEEGGGEADRDSQRAAAGGQRHRLGEDLDRDVAPRAAARLPESHA